jgi:hypothetical protein
MGPGVLTNLQKQTALLIMATQADEFEDLPGHEPAWMLRERATRYRKRLLAAGYRPLPVNGKAPPIEGWSDIQATDKIIVSWEAKYTDATNSGILTCDTPGIDIDIMVPDAAAAVEALAREHFEEHGSILVRFGRAPKRLILLRTDEPFKKIERTFTAPDGSAQQIEILAHGQQVVVAGIHPDTGKPYSWHGGEPGEIEREKLPSVCEADMRAFIDAAAELLIREFGFKKVASSRKAHGGEKKPRAKHDDAAAGIRERAWAQEALERSAAELAAATKGERNKLLYKKAFRLGRMIARGWLDRAEVEAELAAAMQANGYIDDDGVGAAEKTIRSGIDAGTQEPIEDLPEQAPTPTAAPQHPRCTLAEVHDVFRKWLGHKFEIDIIDAAIATAAAERLTGDPLWLLIVSGPGAAKTESAQSLVGAGAHIISTIASEGALLSATSKKSRIKNATGGLLRKIGERGVLVIKDFTSILSSDRVTRAGVLAALREVYDGTWVRNVGTDGGQTLEWRGRIAVIGAVTTAWDAAHAVVTAMGDRFVVVRSNSAAGRVAAGRMALRNVGAETAMRAELAAAVGGVVGSIDSDGTYELRADEEERLLLAADIVTFARTAVERDYAGNVIDAHAPEMPTRFVKQLKQMVRGSLALGMDRDAAMRLALRCARDSVPPLRIGILLDLASNPRSRPSDVSKRITKPWTTTKRELEALHTLSLLQCDEEQSATDVNKSVWYYSLSGRFDRDTLLAMVDPE